MIWTTRQRSEGAGALEYFEEGQGSVVVLIHGVGLKAEAWNAVAPLLSDRYRVLCVDMPGHGGSALRGSHDLAEFTARLGVFIEALEGPVCLAGHSMGALLAVELAAALPQKVAAVAALNMVYGRSAQAAEAVKARASALAETGMVDPGPTLSRWFGDAPAGADEKAAVACRDWLIETDPKGYAAAYRLFARHDGPSEDTLARISCPALFMTGAADPNSTPAMSQALAARTDGRCHVMLKAAHMMPMTHGQTVAEQIRVHFDAAHSPKIQPDP